MKQYCVVNSERKKLGRFEVILDTVIENDNYYPYSYVSVNQSVGILALTGDYIVLIKQYRHALGRYEIEIPGGGVENGELPMSSAIRELKEETGFQVKTICELGKYYPSPGSTNEICTLFLAECQNQVDNNIDPLEYVETVLLKKDEFELLIREGKFRHSMGLVAWLYYINMIGEK